MSPEVSAEQIRRGDLSTMGRPILVAAMSDIDVAHFRRGWGLRPDEVRRVRRWAEVPSGPVSRVLIQLPGWHHDRATDDLVARWVAEEGYTHEIDCLPLNLRDLMIRRWWARVYTVVGMICVAGLGAQLVRTGISWELLPWVLGVAGWLAATLERCEIEWE